MDLDPLKCRWRVGRSVGRTVYAMCETEPSDDDSIIGMMDSVELANEVVMLHNRYLEALNP